MSPWKPFVYAFCISADLSIEFQTMRSLIFSALVKESSHSCSEGLKLRCPLQRTPTCLDRSERAIILLGCD
jgi:hypothetical protein